MDSQADRYERDRGDDDPHRTQDGNPLFHRPQARQAFEAGAMRYVLGVSLGLVAVVLAVAYLITIVYRH
jgi:hypothetical protein